MKGTRREPYFGGRPKGRGLESIAKGSGTEEGVYRTERFRTSLLEPTLTWTLGARALCNEEGLRVSTAASRRSIPYTQIKDVSFVEGRLWGTASIIDGTGKTLRLHCLPAAPARRLVDALKHNHALHIGNMARAVADQLERAHADLDRLRSAKAYIAEHMLKRLLVHERDLSPLIKASVMPGVLSAPVLTRINDLREFFADPQGLKETINTRFIDSELKELKPFFDMCERHPLTLAQRTAVIVNEDCNLVVAAAGSGKTSVIIAKTAYLIHKGLQRPADILCLAFGRAAASEMSARLRDKLGVQVEARTFHALGLEILAAVEGKVPSLSSLAEDDAKLQILIRDMVFAFLSQKGKFARVFAEWFQSYFAPYRSLWDFDSLGDYWEYVVDRDIRTLKGERVKSFEECEIANWLYLNGIDYEYERKYEHDLASRYHRQYKPDFYLKEWRIYIEHFALRRDGSTPPFIDTESYLREREWKKAVHAEYGTTLIETFSFEKAEGILLAQLEGKIEASLGHPIETEQRDSSGALQTLRGKGIVDDFSRLVATFLRHFKGSQLTQHELERRASVAQEPARAKAFVEIFLPLFDRYQDELSSSREVDFEDMISRATEHVSGGRYNSPYKYILVDEFQDISAGRARLLTALLSQADDAQLLSVGDDWQAIYRFAGSDVNLMRDFPQHFGVTARTDLGETFRCSERIAVTSSRFILRNEAQLPKTVTAVRKEQGGIHVCYYERDKELEGLARVLENLSSLANGEKTEVLLLGRYNRNVPRNLKGLRRQFPNLVLEFQTVHRAKGLEADNVVVLGLTRGRIGFPTGMVDDPLLDLVLAKPEPFPHAEERRLFYVAMTRAKRSVFLLADRDSPSPFISELVEEGYDVIVEGDAKAIDHICPTCKKGKLIVRQGDKGSFVGCSFFPLCAHIEQTCDTCGIGLMRPNVDGYLCANDACHETRARCPQCAGGWLKRRERRDGAGAFLGCSTFPACRYTENADV